MTRTGFTSYMFPPFWVDRRQEVTKKIIGIINLFITEHLFNVSVHQNLQSLKNFWLIAVNFILIGLVSGIYGRKSYNSETIKGRNTARNIYNCHCKPLYVAITHCETDELLLVYILLFQCLSSSASQTVNISEPAVVVP
jgi:hypothetical protein